MGQVIIVALLVPAATAALSGDNHTEYEHSPSYAEPQSKTFPVKFGQLCSSNPRNQARGCDRYGCGAYGAKRLHGRHWGLDIACNDGAIVYAPFNLYLNGKSFPYGRPSHLQKLINDGVTVTGAGLCVKLWYFKPDKYRGFVRKGQRIGVMGPMQKVYRGITSHTHVQMCDRRTDPTKYF